MQAMGVVAIMNRIKYWMVKMKININYSSASTIHYPVKRQFEMPKKQQYMTLPMKTVDECINHRWKKLNLKP